MYPINNCLANYLKTPHCKKCSVYKETGKNKIKSQLQHKKIRQFPKNKRTMVVHTDCSIPYTVFHYRKRNKNKKENREKEPRLLSCWRWNIRTPTAAFFQDVSHFKSYKTVALTPLSTTVLPTNKTTSITGKTAKNVWWPFRWEGKLWCVFAIRVQHFKLNEIARN